MAEYTPLTPTSIPSPTTSSMELYSFGLQYPPTPKEHRTNALPEPSQSSTLIDKSCPPSIKLLGVPQTGAKSRVETQIKVVLQLENVAHNHWNFVRLPYGSASKKRSKRGAPMPYQVPRHNTLYLETQVMCASPPNCPVFACTPCRERERKRFQRKREARRRPRSKSDDEEFDDDFQKTIPSSVKDQGERNKIILFNCGELVPLAEDVAYEGAQPLPTAVLPTRVTCYCRHHREKTGFVIEFTLKQHDGSIVASTKSPPIMITDDHKSSTSKLSNASEQNLAKSRSSLKSTRGIKDEATVAMSYSNDVKPRKPYTRNTKRQQSPLDLNHMNSSSPSFVSPSDYSVSNVHYTTPSTTPSPPRSIKQSLIGDAESTMELPATLEEYLVDFENTKELETYLTSSLSVQSPMQINEPVNTLPQSNPPLSKSALDLEVDKYIDSSWIDDILMIDKGPESNAGPKISRIVPFEGPTRGGTEITILGQNFSDGLTAYFGTNAASRLTRWGEGTLVCLLPPSSKPGPVNVTLRGPNSSSRAEEASMSTFTYIDESDKALMELALKVLGYNLTGKFEDARNVAMRIVGTENVDQLGNGASTSTTPGSFNLEAFTIQALRLLEYSRKMSSVDLLNKQRQTLLHLSCQLSLVDLTQILIENEADVNARDINGFTPLHFAFMSSSEDCANLLYRSGADVEIVDACGNSPQELGAMLQSKKLAMRDSEDADDEISVSSSEDDSSVDDAAYHINTMSGEDRFGGDRKPSRLNQSSSRDGARDDHTEDDEEIKYRRKAFDAFLTNFGTRLSEKTGWNTTANVQPSKVDAEAISEQNDVLEEDWSTKARKRVQSVVEDVRLMLFWAPVLLLSLIFSFISIAPFINKVGNQLAPLLGLEANSE